MVYGYRRRLSRRRFMRRPSRSRFYRRKRSYAPRKKIRSRGYATIRRRGGVRSSRSQRPRTYRIRGNRTTNVASMKGIRDTLGRLTPIVFNASAFASGTAIPEQNIDVASAVNALDDAQRAAQGIIVATDSTSNVAATVTGTLVRGISPLLNGTRWKSMAQQWDYYRITNMRVGYVPSTGVDQVGRVKMVFDPSPNGVYNLSDAAVHQNQCSASNNLWNGFGMTLTGYSKSWKKTSLLSTENRFDPVRDLGVFYAAAETTATPTGNSCGELFLEYDVEFKDPSSLYVLTST
jgi:hypothetical protein